MPPTDETTTTVTGPAVPDDAAVEVPAHTHDVEVPTPAPAAPVEVPPAVNATPPPPEVPQGPAACWECGSRGEVGSVCDTAPSGYHHPPAERTLEAAAVPEDKTQG